MAQRKEFSSSRAASRVKRLSEDEVVFGQAASSKEDKAAKKAANPGRPGACVPNQKPKRELTHQVTVLLDDDLFYRMKMYFAQPGARWRSASVMLRELLEEELGRNG